MFRKCLSLQVSQTWSLDFLPRHVWHSLWPWLGLSLQVSHVESQVDMSPHKH